MIERKQALSGLLLGLGLLLPTHALAELTIADDDAVVEYAVEVEPHGVFTPFWPPAGSADAGLGAGVLVGINLARRGFIPGVADSVALGVGFDWVHYFGGRGFVSECAEHSGTGAKRICVRTESRGGGSGGYFYLPAVMQWNFYLTEDWSVFGEPGFATYVTTAGLSNQLHVGLTPVFNVGGRYHFSERVTLTSRVGYPYTTFGLSIYF